MLRSADAQCSRMECLRQKTLMFVPFGGKNTRLEQLKEKCGIENVCV